MSRVNEFISMLKQRRLGFKMDEVMSGTHIFEPGMGPAGEHKFEFRVTWGPEELGPWISPGSAEFMTQPLAGTLTAEGLCEDAPVTGTLELKYFSERKIRYGFGFSVAGKPYRFLGEKVNIWPWNLPVSHTTCFGTLVEADTGRLVSRSVTFFKMKTAPQFLASLRLA